MTTNRCDRYGRIINIGDFVEYAPGRTAVVEIDDTTLSYILSDYEYLVEHQLDSFNPQQLKIISEENKMIDILQAGLAMKDAFEEGAELHLNGRTITNFDMLIEWFESDEKETPYYCGKCGIDIWGNTSICPECGWDDIQSRKEITNAN